MWCSTMRARRSPQTNLELTSSRRLSKSDWSHTARTTTQTFSGSSFRLSELSLNTKHPLFLVDEAIGAEEDQKKAESKETGDVVSKTKGELARKRSLDNFIDGEAKALENTHDMDHHGSQHHFL